MSLKSTLGYHIYRGRLRPFMKELARVSIRIGMPNKEITFRALHLLLDQGQAKADDLRYFLSKVENHTIDTKIFLLHIPKTAGTSIRETLGEAIGVPAITYYQNENDRRVLDWHNLEFWPFFSGHLHIDYFPATHRGVTAFRESRSRVLAQFRQVQRSTKAILSNRDIVARKESLSMRDKKHISWELFKLNFFPHDCSWFFTAGHKDAPGKFVMNGNNKDIQQSITLGLSRIEAATWSHDAKSVHETMRNFIGIDTQIKRVNVFPENEVETVCLTKDDLVFLDTVAKRDDYVFQAAESIGLISKLARSEKDAIFEKDVKRLGFKLP